MSVFINLKLSFTRRCRQFAMVAMTLISCVGATSTHAQTAASELDVRAAYIFNFLRLIAWPNEAVSTATILVCTSNKLPASYETALSALTTRKIEQSSISMRSVGVDDSLRGCNVLVTDAIDRDAVRWIDKTKGTSILSIGESEASAKAGMGVAFVNIDSRVRFVLNVDALNRAQLKPSSRLLQVAIVVKDGS
jgi:hypothetical protein